MFHMRYPLTFFVYICVYLTSLSYSVSAQHLTIDDIGASYEWVRSYKNAGGENLSLFAFYPEDWNSNEKRTAVVFFHGGGWVSGNPSYFFPHCRYFASRGAVAFSVQYRLADKKGIEGLRQVGNCIADCKSALRYIRENSDKFGIDSNSIAVAGDSAGGHLAAALGLIDSFHDPGDNLDFSARSQACICFNPVADLNYDVIYSGIFAIDPVTDEARNLADSFSPVANVCEGAPPMLIMHGSADTVVPAEQSRRLADSMKKAGNRCDLIILEGAPHAFAINWAGTEETIVRSLREMDKFLISLGMLEGEPSIKVRR